MVDQAPLRPLIRKDDSMTNEPCGESGCFCHGTSSEHEDCACGCDCPRCWDCLQKADNCDC